MYSHLTVIAILVITFITTKVQLFSTIRYRKIKQPAQDAMKGAGIKDLPFPKQ